MKEHEPRQGHTRSNTPPVNIEASKDGVRFSCQGDIGSGSVTIRQNSNVEKPEQDVKIALSEPVSLTFSLKYLVNFCKASGLSTKVKLCLSQEVPLLVEYTLSGSSYLRFYLAPKVRYSCFAEDRSRMLTFTSRLGMMNDQRGFLSPIASGTQQDITNSMMRPTCPKEKIVPERPFP